jgi:pimeloyl-ACP methyl ester carboxylesterase
LISAPTVTIGSDFDGGAADGRAYAEKFSHRVLEGVGHNVPHEAPGAFTDAILEVGGGLP